MAALKLAWHFDFHSHKSARIGHAPDFNGIAGELQRHGVEEVIMDRPWKTIQIKWKE